MEYELYFYRASGRQDTTIHIIMACTPKIYATRGKIRKCLTAQCGILGNYYKNWRIEKCNGVLATLIDCQLLINRLCIFFIVSSSLSSESKN